MGMFDDFLCRYPLPIPEANELDYQTKSTPAQGLDLYELRADGTLWHEDYDVEDRSDYGVALRAGKDVSELGLASLAGCLTRVNKRWVPEPLTGEIRFYTMYGLDGDKMVDTEERDGWIEWSAYFKDGKLQQLNLIENRKPTKS